MQKRFPNPKLFQQGLAWCIFVSGVLYFLYKQTDQRLIEHPSSTTGSFSSTRGIDQGNQKETSGLNKASLPVPEKLNYNRPVSASPSEKEIWCEVKDYQDLSHDPIFPKFSQWLEDFNSLNCPTIENCQDHDPRMLALFISEGKSLARTRANLFKKIIRADPKRALQLAIPEEIMVSLPKEISSYLEKWESGLVDLHCIHHCFDSTLSGGGRIMRYAQFNDGRQLRAWTYGKHKRLTTTKGIALWGVSMGEDFAASDISYRIKENASGSGKLWFAGGDVAFKSSSEKEFIIQNLKPSIRRVGGVMRVKYPIVLASGMTLDRILDQKYEINATLATFDEALAAAIEKNGSLLRIDNQQENELVMKHLLKAFEEEKLIKGLDEFNQTKTYIWIGATDNEEQNGTRRDTENNVTVEDVDINASEGNWRWINGIDEDISYSNWKWGAPPENNDTEDFAAMDWNTSGATWVDINETARLPFIIEKNFEISEQETDLRGVRKVLVIPARFVDETAIYQSALDGSNNPLTNELGENILDELQLDSYEPISRETIDQAMNEVSEFFFRNTDGQLELVPVVSPTVTLPLFRYLANFTLAGSSPYDSEGNFTGPEEIMEGDGDPTFGGIEKIATRTVLAIDPDQTPDAMDLWALRKAADLGPEWNYWTDDSAFKGVASIDIAMPSVFANIPFPKPPNVQIIGGEKLLDNNSTHPRFVPATVEAVITAAGIIEDFKIIEPGAYYDEHQDISLVIDGVDYSDDVTINIEPLLVSYVVLSNFSGGAPGVGFMGAPGAHVMITQGSVSSSTITHEIGHNFGLFHAERYSTKSELILSDEADQIEYGNPYSVMGEGAIRDSSGNPAGDLTIIAKVALNNRMSAGYSVGTAESVDVLDIDELSILEEATRGFMESKAETNNTIRIYRSNYGVPPLRLKEGTFSVELPQETSNQLKGLMGSPYELQISGTGQEANGTLVYDGVREVWELIISNSGRGFVEEPSIRVLGDDNTSLLILDPSWIKENLGFDHVQTATLIDQKKNWLRGIRVKGNGQFRPAGNIETGLLEDLTDYFLSYRTDIATNGLTLNITNSDDVGAFEAFLLDATPQTPRAFLDGEGALLLGKTYSDYDADVHFTPIRTGGNEPMPFIEVVVHAGSVSRGQAAVPNYELIASNTLPAMGEYVKITANVDGNASDFAYSWYVNEQPLTASKYLNNPSIFLNFNKAGHQIVRVQVSDMRGGVGSRNLVISVGNKDNTNQSVVTGTVRSRQNPVQGARVVLEKSPVIEHNLSLAGNLYNSFFPSGVNEPAQFLIDGEIAPELHFHRGEIHRFLFDSSLEGVDMSFLEGRENAPPKIILDMLSDARSDLEKGSGYVRNPGVNYTYSSTFANYRTRVVDTYLGMLEYLQEHQSMMLSSSPIDINATQAYNTQRLDLLEYLEDESLIRFDDFNNTTQTNLISRPYAKALMQETGITRARVGPREINEFGAFLAYGGRGYDRNDTPEVEVRRASIWEDYNKTDANATAYVDGVGTISPVIANSFMGNVWESRPGDSVVPHVVVWGSGGGDLQDPDSEVEANVTNWMDDGAYMRTITIYNQGKGFEPNSTMAVLHYPVEPFAYWSFDRHESLFEDMNNSRHQPNPGWNLEPDAVNLKHYWRFDTNTSGGSDNEINASARFSGTQMLNENSFKNWGLLGKAIEVNSTNEVHALRVLDENFTLSMWVKPEGDFEMNFTKTGERVIYRDSSRDYELSDSGEFLEAKVEDYWTHIGIVSDEGLATLFIDGRASSSQQTITASDLNITSTNTLLLDDVRIYDVPLSDAEVRYLAGRTYLDLSGNQYHAAPMGSTDFLPISPESVTAGDGKVPEFSPYPNSTNGSGRLGDSFSGELNGLSLQFDGASDYLDLSTHSLEFGLPAGTFSVWVKTTSSQSPNPLFWLSSPPIIDVFTDTDTNETEITITPGSFFALELSNGLPRLGGIGANSPSNRVNDGQWHHIAASFPFGQIWVDGTVVSTSNYDLQDTLYEGFDNLFSFSADADTMNIGRAMDRTIRDQEIFFNGRMDDFILYDRQLTNDEVSYLYNLRRGREQLPRLDAVVDAVGTVDVNEGGAGYRENPELVFWYGGEENKTDLDTFPTLASLEGNITDANGTHGLLAYVEDEDAVYSFHQGVSSRRLYNWRKGNANGWRRLIDAQGIGEFEDASVGEIVWVKKMPTVTTLPLPDGRMVDRLYVDYVTMDQARSTPLELNASYPWPHPYYQPNGLFGFNEKVVFSIAPPTIFNPEAIEDRNATAFSFYFLDPDVNETVTILDGGHGINSIPASQVRINGSGYQPATPYQKEEDYPGFADIDTWDTSKPQNERKQLLSLFGGVYDWNGSEDVNVSLMEFNRTFSSVSVDSPGFGYSMPVELKVIGGFPQKTNEPFNLQEYNATEPYQILEAQLEVNETDPETGAIRNVRVLNGGLGYVNYQELPEDEYPYIQYPMISVTGGGGRGAMIQAIVEDNGSISGATIVDGGIGYFNYKRDNRPIAKHSKFSLGAGEKNATLEVKLGGYLKEIPRCTMCAKTNPEPPYHDTGGTWVYSHLEPWIEIWDRGRSETYIDDVGDRAHAAPKVINGQINKVVVTNSGRGYIDPVAIVRDAPPKHMSYRTDDYRRKWKCTFPRTTEDGRKVECGHVHWGPYPPENCPGETDDQFPYEDENGTLVVATADQITDWRKRHDDSKDHEHCNVTDNPETETHLDVGFLVRKCWGTKSSYILHDDAIYRNPRSDWIHMDANLSVICKNGRIIEIVVEDNGSNYYASQIYVEGSGSGVDAFPVFDEYGLNTSVILDDPKLKNLEIDQINRPKGAGQGFQERPWTWDQTNDALYGYPERLQVIARHPEEDGTIQGDWNFGTPILEDHLGDRILSVEVIEPGLYSSGRSTPELSDITIEFNSSLTIDNDFNGSADFVEAKVKGFSTSVLSKFVLGDTATYDDNSTGTVIERGLFDERPDAIFLDGRNLFLNSILDFGYEEENKSTYIRLNDVVDYDADSKKSYIELYIDDRFPTQLFYGNGVTRPQSQVVPKLGNRILVSEPVPASSWALDEPTIKKQFSYTDQNGQYAFGNLDPGMYNVTVFLEDIKWQESTFRPQSSPTRISEVLYVPGFPQLVLESDNLGEGKSALVWSLESRNLVRPSQQLDAENEFLLEFYNKTLQGVGRGFDPSQDPPELTFIPDGKNIGTATPEVDLSVNADGSLNLTIVDNEATTAYFPGDRFTIVYSSSITGVDFFESFYFSESNQTINFGSAGSETLGEPKLVIFPDDSGGLNPLEVPLSTSFRGDQAFNLNGVVFDANGSIVDAPIDWSIQLDFNASDGNNSRVAQLLGDSGVRDVNATGDQVRLYLYSTLRQEVGSIKGLEILSGGTGYSQGDKIRFSEGYGFDANITEVDDENGSILAISTINQRGFNISKNAQVIIWDANLTNLSTGSGATILPVFFSGLLTVEANASVAGTDLRADILIRPSSRNTLSAKERWLNKYLDSFMAKSSNWWGEDTDEPLGEGLINEQEYYYGTSPLVRDTDLDALNDRAEVAGDPTLDAELIYNSNPLIYDSDNDGWSDFQERYNDLNEDNPDADNTTNPRDKDTDGDGLNDPYDLDPLLASGDGIISGRIFKKTLLYGESNVSTVYFRYAKTEDINSTAWSDSWTGQPTSFYLSGLTEGNYTVQAFVDYYSPKEGNYTYGEPIASELITLSEEDMQWYGANLIPLDPPPILYFDANITDFSANGISVVNDKYLDGVGHLEQNVTVEANATNAQNLSEFEWGIIGKDPHYDEENNVSVSQGIFFEITDGNFSEFLEIAEGELTAFEGMTARFDLGSVPVGKYFLTYSVKDEFGNYAENSITHNIEIRDAEPPEISFLFQGGGITTLASGFPESEDLHNNSNSSAVIEWDITGTLSFSDQLDEESDILIRLFDLKNHFENDFENTNQPDWNVSINYSNDYNFSYSSAQDIVDQLLDYTELNTTAQSFDLNTSVPGTFKLEFKVTDQAGNLLEYDLYIIVKPGAVTEVTAVDGYLSNAKIIFDADGDGLSDINRDFYTNSNGRAKIILSQKEMETFDLNNNGKLDPNEGKFIVIGGIDTTTGTKFSGKLIADANSSVISPLTTMISKMMDLGATKAEAVTALALALQLDTTIDFTNYDPIQKAFEGDSRASSVMMANLRMANLVNQAEGLLIVLSSEYQGHEIGSALLGEIAKGLTTEPFSLLDLENALVDALPTALASVGTAGELSLEDQLAMFQLMADLDQSILNYGDTDFTTLMDRQRDIINDLEILFEGVGGNEHNLSLRTHHLQISYLTGGIAGNSGAYSYGSKVQISATPEEGYRFTGWTGDGILDVNAASTFVIMTGDRNVSAQFAPKMFEISIDSAIGGQVNGAGTYQYGKIAQLSAVSEQGYEFRDWIANGVILGSGPNLEITVTQNLSLIARFFQPTPQLDLSASRGGSVLGSGVYNLGEWVHLQAIADDGYVFSGWTGEGIDHANSSSIEIVMSENRSVHATFASQPANTHSLVLESVPSQGGKTYGTGPYSLGATVNISASALHGYSFDQWIGEGIDEPTNASTSIVLSNNIKVQALFSPLIYELTVDSGEGGITLGGGSYPYGSVVNITALPNYGHRFIGWEGVDIAKQFDEEIAIQLSGHMSVKAIFEPIQYNLEINSTDGGVVYGQGTYNQGTLVQISAVPSTGYEFAGWKGKGVAQNELMQTSVSLDEDTYLTASFDLIDNYFTPRAESFSLWVNRKNYQSDGLIYYLYGQDGDGDEISYQLISGNIDKDKDGVSMFNLQSNGGLTILDPDEISQMSGSSLKLIISLQDAGGKSSEVEGTIIFAPEFVMNSELLNHGWYESSWLGIFLQMENSWLYHHRLGWLFVHSLDTGGYWFWDSVEQGWWWTEKSFFPWVYSNSKSSWVYFNLNTEKVRFFNHNLQEWDLRP